ncbi:MAG TPA: DNA replication and repair protein RecF [Gaiellaceae bacterium]|nr:DNA replication and repair protein RecF [Gaiellaceae bacterium]
MAETVSLVDFRSYARLELGLQPGLVLAVGRNGVGKTNLLEALHVGTQGFSPRTRTDAQLVRFGAAASRIAVRGRRGTTPLEVEIVLEPGSGKRARLNGAPLASADQLRAETATLVFTPDRLGVVKGAPAARRAYFDRALGRLSPARAHLAAEYGAAVAQRNASLRRVAGGFSSRDALAPWTMQVAELGTELVAARREALALLGPPFAERAGELGLEDAELRYDGAPVSVAALEDRLQRDLDRGMTGLGPHLDDVVIASGTRELRSFGSQGEQRLAVLALLLAEAELITDRRGFPPLLLLDDVLSELDPERRRILAARVARVGQALITATDAAMLPAEPDQLLEVAPGTVRAVA